MKEVFSIVLEYLALISVLSLVGLGVIAWLVKMAKDYRRSHK